MPDIIGQPRVTALFKRLVSEKAAGRTILLEGSQGLGKFHTALSFTRQVLGKNPFLSPDFTFYRNDNFPVKTRFFLDNAGKGKINSILPEYLFYLMGRMSLSVAYNEISKSALKLKKLYKTSDSANLNDFRAELEEALMNGKALELLQNNKAFRENLELISDELAKKKKIPIDFIRSAIEFNSRKSVSGLKITVIGGFESASEEAQNASLKLFEEPSDTALIILTADDTSRILPTILSRSVRISFQSLSPRSVAEIFGMENPSAFTTTSGFMEDKVSGYTDRRRALTVDFFTRIAPAVQFGNEVFGFIDSLGQDDPAIPELFIEEISEFLRYTHLYRQLSARGIQPDSKVIPVEYNGVLPGLAANAVTSEIAELADETAAVLKAVRRNNGTPGVLLPSLLIKLARWYQLRAKRN